MPTSSKGRIRKCILNRRKLKRAEGTEFFYVFFFLEFPIYLFIFFCILCLHALCIINCCMKIDNIFVDD